MNSSLSPSKTNKGLPAKKHYSLFNTLDTQRSGTTRENTRNKIMTHHPSRILLAISCALHGLRGAHAFAKSPSPISGARCSSMRGDRGLKFSSGDMIQALDEFYTTMPIQSAFVTCAVKASAADAVAQMAQLKKEQEQQSDKAPALAKSWKTRTKMTSNEPSNPLCLPTLDIQIPRNLAFLLYGGLYQGIAQHFLYNVLFPQWFGVGTDPLTVACKVLTDIVLIAPHFNLPISYMIKSAVYRTSSPLTAGLEKYQNDVIHKDLLFKYWGLWAPVNSIMFTFVPEHLRIPFVASASFFWLILLSSLSSQPIAVASTKTPTRDGKSGTFDSKMIFNPSEWVESMQAAATDFGKVHPSTG